MTWNDITVKQWQEYISLMNEVGENPSALELIEMNEKLISIMYGLPMSKVEILTESDFANKVNGLAFLNKPIEGTKPKKRIFVNGNVYRLKYDVRKHTHTKHIAMFSNAGDVISVKEFSKDFANNIGKVLASMVVPQRKILGLYFDKKPKPTDHEVISQDVLDAKFIDVYNACIFFCKLLEKLIVATVDYLAKRKELTKDTKQKLMDLLKVLDGFTLQNK